MVWRPEDPEGAVKCALKILDLPADQRPAAMHRMLTDQIYTPMGYLENGQIVDAAGVVVGPLEPGDSFVEVEDYEC
jgi:hypothetical protein